MIEMRREKRWPAKLELEISSLFKQDNVKVENLNAPIEVVDVSKAGIGFKSESVLPIGYYFNARLVLGEQDVLTCVVRIIRQQKVDNHYIYGCEIVGAASIMDYVINDYAASIEQE
ncbi:MAG: PilZ domain-containing protein [Lachnospiraceae bacterium]|nr:PilZ domain-containing protein [Lachnospiraceae bacterium]